MDVYSRALRAAADKFDAKAEDVNKKIGEFDGRLRVEQDAFGVFWEADDLHRSYSEGVDSALERLREYRDNFQIIAQNLRDSADAYEKADKSSTIGG